MIKKSSNLQDQDVGDTLILMVVSDFRRMAVSVEWRLFVPF